MILSGEKTEEYREIKPYWCKRLFDFKDKKYFDEMQEQYDVCSCLKSGEMKIKHDAKVFDTIRFTNGYSKNAPSFEIECKGISIGKGCAKWGAPVGFDGMVDVFIISLGKIITKTTHHE